MTTQREEFFQKYSKTAFSYFIIWLFNWVYNSSSVKNFVIGLPQINLLTLILSLSDYLNHTQENPTHLKRD